MTFSTTMLGDDALRASDDGFEVDLHLSWYRSLPLSSVSDVELVIEGERVGRSELRFGVNGNDYSLDELADRWEEIWFVLDPATLRCARRLVARGVNADVTVRLVLRIPYILIGPDMPLEFAQERTRTLVAR